MMTEKDSSARLNLHLLDQNFEVAKDVIERHLNYGGLAIIKSGLVTLSNTAVSQEYKKGRLHRRGK